MSSHTSKLLYMLIFTSAFTLLNVIFIRDYDWLHLNPFQLFSNPASTTKPIGQKRQLLLDTTYCKIPDINPFDATVMALVKRSDEIHCSQKASITYTHESELKLDRSKIEKEFGGNLKYCQYTPIRRGPKSNDFHFVYGNVSEKFDHDITVPPEDEFIRVDCYNRADVKIATNYHAFIIPKESVEKRSDDLFKEHVKKQTLKETYNVQMVGVDSVSRLNFIRQMQQTRKFLREELQAFELTGYNKVADNTFVNIVPILTGMFVGEMTRKRNLSDPTFDKYLFLWKRFSNAGYRTLYAEDAPRIGIFTYKKPGFRVAPVDYYNRPLSVAMEKDNSIWNKHHHCVADRLETTMLLHYVTDFSRVFKNKPHFGFTFISRLTHDYIELAGAADFPYFKFLKQFKDEGHFNNTVLVFYSDHGMRYGKIRTTYIGKVEERMPFFYFVFPPSFHQKYPELVNNLRTNARRLTTPFDIHETLKDILYFDGVTREANRSSRGISLFREIPEERTCDQAGILPHWCVCMEQKPLDTNSKLAIDIGNALVSQINAMLVNVSHVCANLTLGDVSGIIQMKSNEKVLQLEQTSKSVTNKPTVSKALAPIVYQTTISTRPGMALFEATLIFDPTNHTYTLGGEISRINSYGHQSRCVNNFLLKMFCFCV